MNDTNNEIQNNFATVISHRSFAFDGYSARHNFTNGRECEKFLSPVEDYRRNYRVFQMKKTIVFSIEKEKLIFMLQHALDCVTVFNMSDALKAKIKQRADFESPNSEAILNLLVAADTLRGRMECFFATYKITSGQYNVLRILRGAGSEGHPRCEIATRMVERAPDITRLVDRLEKQKLVIRERSDEDRRQSVARISQKGLDLLDLIEPKFSEFNNQFAKKLSVAEWIALTSLCEKIYANQNGTE